MDIYSFLMNIRIMLDMIFIILMLFSVWVFLPNQMKEQVIFKIRRLPLSKRIIRIFKKNENGSNLINHKEQVMLFVSIIFTNIFTCASLGDFYIETPILSLACCLIQSVGISLLFIRNSVENTNTKTTVFLGAVGLILNFTNIFCWLHYYSWLLNDNWHSVFWGMDDYLPPIKLWGEVLFYSISLVIPYPLTRIQPNSFLIKTVSLIQIGLFYLLIFNKIKSVFESLKNTGDNNS